MNWLRFLAFPLILFGGLAVAGVLVAGLVIALAYPSLPSLDVLTDYQPKIPLRFYTVDGALIGEFGEERRSLVSIQNVPTSVVVTAGLALAAALLWNLESTWARRAWAVGYGLVNSGAVALLALVLEECFGGARIGSLLGGAMFFCMGATLVANQWTAWVCDQHGSYLLAWQTYTVLMTLTLVPTVWLWQRGGAALAPRP